MLLSFFLVPLITALALRPSFTATALLVVETAPADLLEPGGLEPPAAPSNALVDGAVELMRSEPVLKRALALVAPIDAANFTSSSAFRGRVLAFFGNSRASDELAPATETELFKLARGSVTINRRGLTPVIAVSVRSASPAFAALLANAVAEAHMERQWTAKGETLEKARALIEAQRVAAGAALLRGEGRVDLALKAIESASAGASEGDQTDDALRSDLRRQLANAEADVAALRLKSAALERRADELATQAVLQMPDARLAAPASAPTEASFPDVKTTAMVSALFATAIAFGAAFTADGWAAGVRSAPELAALVGAPMALSMPRIGARRHDGSSHADQVITAPLSPFSEAMRSLQLELARGFGAASGRVVSVMSAGPGEGKTTTALGLARACAAAGQNVLLLDADLRSAALRQHIDVPSARGLDHVLSGAASLADLSAFVQRDPLSMVTVLVNSGPSRLPAEALFGTPVFGSLLASARASFDVTVIDMPSFQWPADSRHILAHPDALVLVAGWGRAERGRLETMLAAIRQAQHGRSISLYPVLSMEPQAPRWPLGLNPLSYSAR